MNEKQQRMEGGELGARKREMRKIFERVEQFVEPPSMLCLSFPFERHPSRGFRLEKHQDVGKEH